jgi:hypothetical protein
VPAGEVVVPAKSVVVVPVVPVDPVDPVAPGIAPVLVPGAAAEVPAVSEVLAAGVLEVLAPPPPQAASTLAMSSAKVAGRRRLARSGPAAGSQRF